MNPDTPMPTVAPENSGRLWPDLALRFSVPAIVLAADSVASGCDIHSSVREYEVGGSRAG